ncbi:MAG: YdgA family protein [Gammaproteobacteria bacterium]
MLRHLFSHPAAAGFTLAGVDGLLGIRVKRTLIILAVLVLVLAVLAPGLVGLLAQDRHENQIEMAMQSSPYIELTTGDFDRGWFSSRGRYRVELSDRFERQATAEKPVEELPALIIDSHLHHGPFALATAFSKGGTLLPVLGTVESKLTLVSADGEPMLELPGAVITNIHFDGGGTARYASGPVDIDDGGQHVTWGGADITAEFDSGATHMVSEGRIDALTAVDDEGRFESGPISFSGDQTLTDYGFRTGESEVHMASVGMASASSGRMKLEEFHVRYAAGMPEEFVVATVEMSLAELQADDWRAGPAVLRFELAHLEPAALGRLVKTMQGMGVRGEPDAKQTAATMAQASNDLRALLANGAIFSLEELRLQTPEGETFVKLHLEFPAGTDPAGGSMLMLAGAADGDLSLKLPMSLVAAAGSENPDSQQYLQMLLESGFVEVQDENYVVDAEYSGGLLTVNGIPVPIPFGAPAPQAVE